MAVEPQCPEYVIGRITQKHTGQGHRTALLNYVLAVGQDVTEIPAVVAAYDGTLDVVEVLADALIMIADAAQRESIAVLIQWIVFEIAGHIVESHGTGLIRQHLHLDHCARCRWI